VSALVKAFVEDSDFDRFRGCVVVVEPSRIRVRVPQEIA